MKKIFLLVLHYRDPKTTIVCLESVLKLQKKDFTLDVLVIDNGGWETPFILPKKLEHDSIHILINPENLGFSGGLNRGFEFALAQGATHVAILNNDTTIDKNLLVELVKPFDRDKLVGITVPKIYFALGSEYHKDRYKKEDIGRVLWYAGGIMDWANVVGENRGVDQVDHGQFDEDWETKLATGCCFLISAEVLEKAGMFNENYFLYYEDADLSVRVIRAGYKIIYTPKGVVWHRNAAGSGGTGSSLQDYYITRNRLIFGFTYASFRAKSALFRESVKLFFKGRPWQRRGVLDYYRKDLGKGNYR